MGPHMCQWIQEIYSQFSAAVQANKAISSPFSLSNGTRQGCLLLPLIFILVLERLLAHIRDDQNIKGIGAGNAHHKVAAYADDLLFFITSPEISIPNLLQALKTYSALSNYKINVHKSEALNINVSNNSEENEYLTPNKLK